MKIVYKLEFRERENCLNLGVIVVWLDIYWFNLNGKIRKIKLL